MKRLAASLSLAVLAAGCLDPGADLAPAAPTGDLDGAADIQRIKRDVAHEVAGLLAEPAFCDGLLAAFGAGTDSVALADALAPALSVSADTARRLLDLDRDLRALKGIQDYSDGLLEVRLIRPDTDNDADNDADDDGDSAGAVIDCAALPVAFEPGGDEAEWTRIEAFTARGDAVAFDPRVRPDTPVLVAGIDGREDLRAGIAYINDELTAHGLRTPGKLGDSDSDRASAATETSKLDYIRLSDDQEPWLSGKAEIYALVSGVDFDTDHVRIEAVDMPYLDDEDKNYYPNQILIFWEPYRFAAANVLLYEHDDNTNYQTLVQALISAVEAVLDLTAPQYSIIAVIANQIVAAMPSGWFSNDDDYVDSFYTLEKNTTYTNYYGAAGNAKITLTPYLLQAN